MQTVNAHTLRMCSVSAVINEPPVLCRRDAECEREMCLAVISVACVGQIWWLPHIHADTSLLETLTRIEDCGI